MAVVTVDGETYQYDPAKMLNTEAMALQKVTGMKVPEWTDALKSGDAFALTGLVWLLWRRAGKHVKFDEVEFDIGGLDLQDDEEPDAGASGDEEAPVGPTEEAAPAHGESAA
jgi:hypothetical protein